MISVVLLAIALTDISRELQTAANDAHVPAMQAAAATSDGLVADGAAGTTILGGSTRVRRADAFHIGSCTKPFTATAAAMLVDEKKLTWDTRVDVFPDWKERILPDYREVTLADLLSHESGVQPFEEDTELATLPKFTGDVVARRRAFAEHVLTLTPAVPPRTAYKYSNAGYVIAGAMIEKVSGKSWEWWMRERIFKPLGMRTAGFGWPSRVWGHTAEGGKLTPSDPKGPYQFPDFLAPAGGLHMSSADLAKFLRMHLRATRGEQTLISSATAAAMHTKRMRSALGFGSSKVGDFENVATYSGSADTFFTVIAIAAKENVAVAVSTNAAGDEAQKAIGRELRALLARYGVAAGASPAVVH
jgi:CubicO group peptidase (beta-lactamase class C family)